jgi:hypothetical protein
VAARQSQRTVRAGFAYNAGHYAQYLTAMKTRVQLQAQFDAAFDNYLELTTLLHKDMESMLLTESNSQQWRRNFIRASAALLEAMLIA